MGAWGTSIRVGVALFALAAAAACSESSRLPPVGDEPPPPTKPKGKPPKTYLPPVQDPPDEEVPDPEPPCAISVEPQALEMGGAPLGCATHHGIAWLFHACGSPRTIEALRVDGSPAFSLVDPSPLPYVLPREEDLELRIEFRPQEMGPATGSVIVEMKEEDEARTISLEGEGRPHLPRKDSFLVYKPNRTDVLLVVNNSVSMAEKRELLRSTLPKWMGLGRSPHDDLRIGVTTTAIGPGESCGSTGFDENEDGRLVPHPELGSPRILDASLDDDAFVDALADNLDVGACHDSTTVLEAARRALSAPWLETPQHLGGNQGFLREGASLSIIGITDRGDEARWKGEPSADPAPSAYVDFFRSLKAPRDRDSVRVHMISGDEEGCEGPGGSAEPCPHCVAAAEESGGRSLEICMDPEDPRWGDAFLGSVGSLAFPAEGADGSFGLLVEPADWNEDGVVDEGDFEVRVDGELVAPLADGQRVWRYNPENNRIAFSPLHFPPPNALVEVSYLPVCR